MSLLSLELNFPKSHKPAKLSAVLSKEGSCAVLVFLVCSWLHQQLLFLISVSRFQLFAKPVQFLFFFDNSEACSPGPPQSVNGDVTKPTYWPSPTARGGNVDLPIAGS